MEAKDGEFDLSDRWITDYAGNGRGGVATFGEAVMSTGLGETGAACAKCAAIVDGLVLPTW